jgi:FkbM family methyltransferase
MARQAFTKLVLLVLLVILVVQFYMLSYLSTDKTDSSSIVTRDFKRYKCLNRVRIGGQWDSVKAAKDDLLFRIDGAWFICADKLVGPRVYHCTVLSFGISFDDSFDLSMNEKYGCHVHSFDPNVEARRFLEARIRRHGKVDDPVKYSRIKVKNNWHFYRFGLTGIAVPPSENSNETTQRNNLLTIEQIYDLTGTRNQVIDIWKMDIEGHERAVFENLDMDYVCKYVKQFMFETHWVSIV